jgi:preprotein translocase subunit SecG
MLHLSTPAAVFLQAVEATKAAAAAAGAVGKHAAESGLSSVLWFLVLLLLIACVILAVLLYKTETGRAESLQKAVTTAREEWAKQQAFDNGHAADLLKQSREQEREALDRLEKINQELRIQDKESVKVIGAVANSINAITSVMQGVQFQLVTIETILTGRAGQPPARPPAPFDPSKL